MINQEEKFKCPVCGSEAHTWHNAYYEENSKLFKTNKSYIAQCNTANNYVLLNILKNETNYQ